MKSKCFIGLLFFCVTSLTAQSGKAIYSKELTSLNNDISNLSLKQKSYRKQILKNLQNWNYQLDFNNKKASYAKQESLHIKTNPVINAMTLGFANFSGSIYFDTAQDIVLNIKEFDGEKYIIKKKKSIGHCQKILFKLTITFVIRPQLLKTYLIQERSNK